METYADPIAEEWPAEHRLVIIDLEFTAWEGSHLRNWSEPWEYREIIQIGAVHLTQKHDRLMIDAELEILVRPKLNPELSSYITELTGITKAMINDIRTSFPQALHQLVDFVRDDAVLLCNGLDGVVLRENCIINAVEYPFLPDRVVNIRPLLANALERPEREVVSSELPGLLGLASPIRKHTGVSDAKCIAAAVSELRHRGAL